MIVPKPTFEANQPVSPRDLPDFLLRWPVYRPLVQDLRTQQGVSALEAEVLGWLVALADRIKAQDLELGS